MIHLLISIFLLSTVYADQCPTAAYNRYDCSTVLVTSGCFKYFQFSWNTTTATPSPLSGPRMCKDPGTGSLVCVASSTTCEPSCLLAKTGGPSGKTCSQLTQSQCANYYADNNGDRWCYYANGACRDSTFTCHD
jgi:hypothetical protein